MLTMHATWQTVGGSPDWHADAEQRLRVSMAVSAIAVLSAISLIRLPPPAEITPLLELVVELTRPAPLVEPEPEPEVIPPPVPLETPLEPSAVPDAPVDTAAPDVAPAEEAATGEGAEVDWEVEREVAIKQVLDAAERQERYSVNPPFERARAEAAVRFRASLAPEARHIWDSVEKDQLGRTILRDGNCWRVLDDPSAVNQWAYENFDQFIVYCDFFIGSGGKELPWVDVIRERYPYLRDPVAIP